MRGQWNNGDPTLGGPRSLAVDCAVTVGARFLLLVMEHLCARGSNRPLEPAEGDVRSIVTECPDVRAVHGKVPLGARDSPRPTDNGANFREGKDNRAAGPHYRCARKP